MHQITALVESYPIVKEFRHQMNLLLFERHELINEVFLRLRGETARHLIEIVRVAQGDTLRVGEIGGRIGSAIVEAVEDETVAVRVGVLNEESQRPWVDLVLALPRPQILKRVLQTAATMGVRRLMLIRSERVERSYFSSPLLAPDKIAYYLRLGLEQGMSTISPEVTVHHRFRPFVEQDIDLYIDKEQGLRLISHPTADTALSVLELQHKLDSRTQVALAIGPEGGWREHEIEAFMKRGFVPFNCGPRILRVDGAVCSLLGQLDLLRSMH
jgi:16S rRNA (uracil1498-N3)-methyltransferase